MPKEVRNQIHPSQVTKGLKPGKWADGFGLYLNVSDFGGRWWSWRGTVHGKRVEIGMGSAFLVGLNEARETAKEWRRIARTGGSPKAVRDAEKRESITFEEAARRVWREQIESVAKNDRHVASWIASLENDAFPVLGKRDMRSITSADILKVLQPIWLAKPETARRVRQRMGTVWDWARASGFYDGVSPLEGISRALPKQQARVKHYPALPYDKLPDLMDEIEGVSGYGALALRFTILTAARSGETRGATWDEIDMAAATWTIPAERMKAQVLHRVPLSPEAIEVLKATPKIEGERLVFPSSKRGTPLSDMTLSAVLKRLGDGPTLTEVGHVVVHGFRSCFRDWAEEQTSTPHEVKEAALAHAVANKVEAAYRRTDLFDKRRGLMESWGRFATGKPEPEGEEPDEATDA
ncbi:tyrosine-type recombinase/integrase [Albidovulum sp.]|uniref:tyrosine-type recombinase/integrase n=1 Tax=Albidovulum sp. TaxID=1872424 RepID=UPI0039B8C696